MTISVELCKTASGMIGRKIVSAVGSDIGEVLSDIERRFPGFKNLILDDFSGELRPRIRFVVNDAVVFSLTYRLKAEDTLEIIEIQRGG